MTITRSALFSTPSYYYACHLYVVFSDTPFQMKNAFEEATKTHLSTCLGRVSYGSSLLWAEFVKGRVVPKPRQAVFENTSCEFFDHFSRSRPKIKGQRIKKKGDTLITHDLWLALYKYLAGEPNYHWLGAYSTRVPLSRSV